MDCPSDSLEEKMRKTVVLFLICFLLTSCTHKQISFDAKKWKNEKDHYYMTASLILKLNEEKPKMVEVFDLLGKPELEGRIKYISYWLKSDGFLAMRELYIYFNDNRNFEAAEIAYAD